MTHTISVHFDGKVLVPDEPIQLPVGEPLRVHVEVPNSTNGKFADLLTLAADLPDAPVDLAAQHDHYLYGTTKR